MSVTRGTCHLVHREAARGEILGSSQREIDHIRFAILRLAVPRSSGHAVRSVLRVPQSNHPGVKDSGDFVGICGDLMRGRSSVVAHAADPCTKPVAFCPCTDEKDTAALTIHGCIIGPDRHGNVIADS